MADNLEDQEHGAHEESDVNVFSISKFGIALTLSVLGSVMLMAWLLTFLTKVESDPTAKPSPIAMSNPQKEPPEPRLQNLPLTDIRQVRADEDKLLNATELLDPDKNIWRIPVDRALELVAKEGLPVRAGGSR